MEYELTHRSAFVVLGRPLRVSMKEGDNFRLIPEFWQKCVGDGTVRQLAASAAGSVLPVGTVVGVCTDFSSSMDEFTYVIGAEKGETTALAESIEIPVPAALWASFEAVGSLPDSIQSVWKAICTEFFGVTEYQHGHGPGIEVYGSGDPSAADYRCLVWVPVVKKESTD
jgi:AraC family transcriptional regulator